MDLEQFVAEGEAKVKAEVEALGASRPTPHFDDLAAVVRGVLKHIHDVLFGDHADTDVEHDLSIPPRPEA